MEHNLLLIHGGGPTAVMNTSLYGAIMEAKSSRHIDRVYGAIGGTEGVLQERFLELSAFDSQVLKRLLTTPASAIGSSRYPLCEKDYLDMIAALKKHSITYVLMNGGNGTMDTCRKLNKVCSGHGILVNGIPKTIDNDIACIDHSPGYGSAARFLSTSVREIGEDVKSLPIHVTVIEAMGRNAGWLTASSCLAQEKKTDAPHLIYLPERPFSEDEFLEDVERLREQNHGGVVAVVSEGLKNRNGEPIVPPIFQSGRSVYYGDVSAYLAQLVIRKLGIKARSEKPGLLGRASVALQSPVDKAEAEWLGREAVRALLEGEGGIMPGLLREDSEEYIPRLLRVPLDKVTLEERTVPDVFLNERGNHVTEAFAKWCGPLVGAAPEPYLNFRDYL